MPRRDDLASICVIGSGPIVIGQACEFDYAGCQALKVLRDDGYRTIVVNSNPATIMTDPGFADRTYLEPLDLAGVAGVLRRERPDALLPTLGGQTALNVARELDEAGVLAELGIELIGASVEVIARAEDRRLFKEAVESCGLHVAGSTIVTELAQLAGVETPAVVRPAYTLGGHGGGFASTTAELRRQVELGLATSPIGQVLVEESLRGWDEFELEVVRDRADNVVIVCSIENLDPMGVHTGDSVTVAPQMTLSDEAYQELRDAAISVVRAVGVDTGGSNIQFARERSTGDLRVIEMNPRVSRSSALASKATGYPIAKVAAKLAVGYTLDEIPNDLTGTTPASFEPALDYVVVKWPRFAFEKFAGADRTLGTQMKSVGEAMGIGRTFAEAFAKARRGLEVEPDWRPEGLHPWFEAELTRPLPAGEPAFRRVDSCAGEVAARSNYFYSTRGELDEAPPEPGRSVVILGSGPNRIGQGIEFDYCCVHAAASFRAQGYEAVLVNCNPETVSTDYDRSDRLYFEPLDEEAVLAVLEREQPAGVCIQFGGQTPLKLARAIERAGFPILGTPFDAVDLAEDRERFGRLASVVGVRCPDWGIAGTPDEAAAIAARVGYPVLVRPSYVLGGRAMRVCYDEAEVRAALAAVDGAVARRPVPRERDRARRRRPLRRDGYVRRGGDGARRGGGDPFGRLVVRAAGAVGLGRGAGRGAPPRHRARRRRSPERPARDPRRRGVRARGEPARLANGAVRVEGDRRQPRRCRLPARRRRVARGARPAAGVVGVPGSPREGRRAAVCALPGRRPGARPRDALDRRGDGERRRFRDRVREGRACRRARAAAGGRAFVSVRDADKVGVLPVARALAALGFELVATAGTRRALELAGIAVERDRQGRRRWSTLVRAPRRRPDRQHARKAETPAATATRSGRRR